ncbi:hypothetical protein [Flavobacterium silvaticum]|uniref:Lipocalin-like domain-containing protein n=1 Tax=Flavobacterium silvaticum TaxID=1852020 RepID=A0A972FTY3_9FLAO|nr:hypothetical protein [Flavobacterium silvaticum]NMH29269.1 hypothetical protein [Flavobacterium silvaticum]
MKKNLCALILLTLLMTILGCSSDDNSNPVAANTQIIGQWNWIQSTGGLAGVTESPESTGNTITLTISDTSVKRYVNGTLASESAYTIDIQPSIFGGEATMLIFPEDMKQSFEISNDILHLNDEFADGFSSTYESL